MMMIMMMELGVLALQQVLAIFETTSLPNIRSIKIKNKPFIFVFSIHFFLPENPPYDDFINLFWVSVVNLWYWPRAWAGTAVSCIYSSVLKAYILWLAINPQITLFSNTSPQLANPAHLCYWDSLSTCKPE